MGDPLDWLVRVTSESGQSWGNSTIASSAFHQDCVCDYKAWVSLCWIKIGLILHKLLSIVNGVMQGNVSRVKYLQNLINFIIIRKIVCHCLLIVENRHISLIRVGRLMFIKPMGKQLFLISYLFNLRAQKQLIWWVDTMILKELCYKWKMNNTHHLHIEKYEKIISFMSCSPIGGEISIAGIGHLRLTRIFHSEFSSSRVICYPQLQ